jgi:subtilase family serine protease
MNPFPLFVKSFSLRRLAAGFLLPVSCFLLSAPVRADQPLLAQETDHVRQAIAGADLVSQLDPATPLDMQIALPLRNQAQLDALIAGQYDPNSPDYHHFLTPAQFGRMFGPTEEDYSRVLAFARSRGLTVTGTSANRTVVDVSGPASVAESVFHVSEMLYQRPDGSVFHAPDRTPTVDAALPVPLLAVGGLDDADPPHPASSFHFSPRSVPSVSVVAHPRGATRLLASTGPGGYSPIDFKKAYNVPASLTGTGVTLGVFQNTGYNASDVTTFENYYGLRNVPLQNVYLDGKTASNQGLSGETTLDIEMQVAMAPNATKILVYIGGRGLDIATKIATDDLCNVCSCSLGYDDGVDAAENQEYEQMATQGQSYFVASGDGGSAAKNNPADQPYVTSVGGTHLNTNSSGVYTSETAWSGSTGGVTPTWGLPSYQQGLSMTANHGSTTNRNYPDVALCADTSPGISFYYNGSWGANTGGTSFAAPLWAGLTALIDQQRAANGLGTVGFMNPRVYTLCEGARYSTDFHDITSGSNGGYSAVAGYDLTTGWGTPNLANLVTDLGTEIRTVSGTVSLQNVASGNLAQPLTFTLTPTGTTTASASTQTVTPAAADGSFTLTGVPAGTYTLGVKGSKWLKRDVTLSTSGGNVTGLNVSLLGGDANGDNQVTALDLLAVKNAYNTVLGAPNYNAAADFNCDGQVTALDLLIVKLNYNKTGDQ